MTITRTRIRCRERACPWPFDEEIHVPWCLAIEGTQHTREAQHQHHPKRSQGGKTIVAILCAFCHDRIDNRDWGNAVKEINGKRVYMIWDLHGEILYERDIGVSTPEGEGQSAVGTAETRGFPPSAALPSPAGPSTGERQEDSDVPRGREGATVLADVLVGPDAGGNDVHSRSGRGSRNRRSDVDPYTFGDNGIEWEPEFTFDDWAAAAARVMRESVGRQWRVGDLVNAERWAECSQFFDDLGYPPETQANYGRISAAYKLHERAPLPWSYHQAVYKHPDRHTLLEKVLANEWDRAELRKQAGYEKRSGLRRFTIEQLRERLSEWKASDEGHDYSYCYDAGTFLEWLGKEQA